MSDPSFKLKQHKLIKRVVDSQMSWVLCPRRGRLADQTVGHVTNIGWTRHICLEFTYNIYMSTSDVKIVSTP